MPRAVACPFEVHAVLHPRGCRSYVVVDPESREALVVDPLLDRVGEVERIVAAQKAGLRWIVDTHAHGDHLSGAAALRARTGAEWVVSKASAVRNATRRVGEGDLLTLGENVLRVRLAPGNAPDAIVLEAPGALFTGDTMLVGTVGARDVPGWDSASHYETLQRIVEPLHETTVVYPGHDDMGREKTTLKAERRGNKWLREKDRDAFVAKLDADPRPATPDADEILAANLEGVERAPETLAAPTTPVLDTPASRFAQGPASTPGLVPEKVGHVLIAGGVVAVLGTLAGLVVHPLFHLLSGAAGAVAIGIGLAGRRPKKKAGPGLYYLGPVPRTPGVRK